VSALFQELDWRTTPWGAISLRRRRDPVSHDDVYEIKLDDDFLMSSQFTVAEIEIARLALADLPGADLDVAVGGLGLGYTAQTVLESTRVRSLVVIDALAEVIEWHQRGLIPAGPGLTADPRCRLVLGDFFAMVEGTGPDNAGPDNPEPDNAEPDNAEPDSTEPGSAGLDPDAPGRTFDAIIVDIDHSPRHVLHPRHAGFYETAGTRRLATHLRPGGVFALWSNDPPDDDYIATLGSVFDDVRAEVVSFANPLQGRLATNTIYLAG
jgi:spermidine synthase